MMRKRKFDVRKKKKKHCTDFLILDWIPLPLCIQLDARCVSFNKTGSNGASRTESAPLRSRSSSSFTQFHPLRKQRPIRINPWVHVCIFFTETIKTLCINQRFNKNDKKKKIRSKIILKTIFRISDEKCLLRKISNRFIFKSVLPYIPHEIRRDTFEIFILAANYSPRTMGDM